MLIISWEFFLSYEYVNWLQHSGWRSRYVSINKTAAGCPFISYSDKLICHPEITQSPNTDKNLPKSLLKTSPAIFCDRIISTTEQVVSNISCEVSLKIVSYKDIAD